MGGGGGVGGCFSRFFYIAFKKNQPYQPHASEASRRLVLRSRIERKQPEGVSV
jgi:hypothetical protein